LGPEVDRPARREPCRRLKLAERDRGFLQQAREGVERIDERLRRVAGVGVDALFERVHAVGAGPEAGLGGR